MAISVLLADDHTVVRDGLGVLLQAQGDIQVIADAVNGREAVRRTQALAPDVVVMDIAMPDMNGIEATTRIRECCPGTEVVILSMHATREHIYRALRAGAQGYLLKESAGQEVVQAVRTVHAGQRYLSQRIAQTLVEAYVLQRAGATGGGPLDLLSAREREVLQLVVEGRSSAEIASQLDLSPKTVDTYRSRLMQKLDIHDLPGLVKLAIQQGLISLE